MQSFAHPFFKAPPSFSPHSTPDILSHTGPAPFDLSIDGGLPFFIALLQAQAQLAIYSDLKEKNAPHEMLSKVAAAAADFYRDAASRLEGPFQAEIESGWPWHAHCRQHAHLLDGASFKQMGLHHHLQAIGGPGVAATGSGMGLSVAWWAAAAQAAKAAVDVGAQNQPHLNSPDPLSLLTEANNHVVQGSSENESIYHEYIPYLNELPVIARHVIAKIPPWREPTVSECPDGDILEPIVPSALLPLLAILDDALDKYAVAARDQVDAASTEARNVLAEVGYPGILDASAQKGNRLPDTLWERISSAAAIGGTAELQRLISLNRDLSINAIEALARAQQTLDEEASADSHMRGKYGAAWPLTTSAVAFANELNHINVLSNQAREAQNVDAAVAKSLEQARTELGLISQSRSALEARIPLSSTPSTPMGSADSEREDLSHNCIELIALIDARPQLVAAIKSRFNRSAFLNMLSRAPVSAQAGLIDSAIAGTLDLDSPTSPGGANPGRAALETNLSAQPPLLNRLRGAALRFNRAAGIDAGSQAQARAVSEISSAADTFTTLASQLRAGNTFWSDLSSEVSKLERSVADSLSARTLYGREATASLMRAASQFQPQATAPPIQGSPHVDNPFSTGFDASRPPPAYSAAVSQSQPGIYSNAPPPAASAPQQTERTHEENLARIAAHLKGKSGATNYPAHGGTAPPAIPMTNYPAHGGAALPATPSYAQLYGAAAAPASTAGAPQLPYFAQEQQFVDMGFDRQTARRALEMHKGNFDATMNQLLQPEVRK